jgi:hypothetical protein
MVFRKHGVGDFADFYKNGSSFDRNSGNVFFLRRINGTGDKFGFVEFSVLFAKVEKDFVAAFTFVNFH